MNAYAFPLAGLPLQLRCYEDGTVAFIKLAFFDPIVDNPADGLQAVVHENGIHIGVDTELEYNTRYAYKEMPELYAYLKSFGM